MTKTAIRPKIDVLKRANQLMTEHHGGVFAGNLTYHALLAIFPFGIFLLSMLFFVGQDGLLRDGIDTLRENGVLSGNAAATVNGQIDALASGHTGALGFGVALSIATALWGVSGAFRSVMEAMNVMYAVEEDRSLVTRYVTSIVMSLVVAALFVGALALVVVGPVVAGKLGTLGEWTWLIAQWPLLILLVLVAIGIVYSVAPNRDVPLQWRSPGGLLATGAWLVFSLAFSWYVRSFGSYNETYGALAGVVIALLYLYFTSFIVLFGAELNLALQKSSTGRIRRWTSR